MGNQYEKTKQKNTNTLERKRIINGKEIEYYGRLLIKNKLLIKNR